MRTERKARELVLRGTGGLLAGLALLTTGPVSGGAAAVVAPRPRAIISLSPNVTEILHGIGAFSRVVAVSDYCTFPPQVEGLPRVGGWLNANLEKVTALRPDLIIMTDDQVPLVKDRLDLLGLRTLVVPSQNIEDVFKAIREIGRAVGNDEEAKALEGGTRAELAAVRGRASGRARPRVLCVVDRLPGTLRDLYVATQGSYLTELIDIAGGDPIAPPGQTNYVKLTTEALVSLDPEVILDLAQTVAAPAIVAGPLRENAAMVWADLPRLRAVRQGRVYSFRDRTVVHPSQFVSETAR
ncbi:MAG TPA: helical backbone metal receptor, partial [Vicinamibacteria bacterium]|nr:helical backbone metal receptor [Vicinamibacteria bacterium]